jgi:hypothetical protein
MFVTGSLLFDIHFNLDDGDGSLFRNFSKVLKDNMSIEVREDSAFRSHIHEDIKCNFVVTGLILRYQKMSQILVCLTTKLSRIRVCH